MPMTPAAIAANRFGLGMRADTPLLGDPKSYLLRQLDAFDPHPAALANVPARGEIAATYAQFIEQRKADKQERADAPKLAQSPAPTIMAQALSAAPIAPAKPPRSPELKAARDDLRELYLNNVAARFNAALTTPAPFVERLVHFWANHFAVSIDKVTVIGFAGSLEFHAIRPHVMGRFGDMLHAVEQHPAMLLYLDQVQSIGPNSVAGVRRSANGKNKVGLNENLAREIKEEKPSDYLSWTINESMRLFPPGWIVSRKNLEDDTVCGYRLKKGTIIIISPWVMHRSEKFWNDPLKFDPLRFTPEAEAKRHKFSYLPFGAGQRMCIGSGFALMELQIVLKALLSNFRFKLAPGHPVVPEPQVTLRPKFGMKLLVEAKAN